MSLRVRGLVVLAILGSGLAVQAGVRSHLGEAGTLPQLPLNKRLVEIPRELGDWAGSVDDEVEDPYGLFGDEYMQRRYYHPKLKQTAVLWLNYSKRGADREHNPVICHAVAGKPEDREVRQTCELKSPGGPVQQYRFGREGDKQWVFYWHYTLLPPPNDELNAFQRAYQRMNSRPASLTVEVFAPETTKDADLHAREFVALVDAAIREHLVGPHAARGSERKPMVMEQAPEGYEFQR